MFRTSSNAGELAKKYRRRASHLKAGVRKGMRDIAARIDIEQEKNLRGGADAPPGAYPVPIRSANLRQSRFFDVVNDKLAVVGNAAVYAAVIHDKRPFLTDAANAVDTTEIMGNALQHEVLAI